MARGRQSSVLIVDDREETGDSLHRLLTLRGYEVARAADGLEAMAMLRGGLKPAVIVLDLWMPNLDGRAFRAQQLADPKLASIPVIIHSVDAGGRELPGIIGFVRKGHDSPDDLLGLIETACGRRA